jgi:uncharacterized membrane protein YfcA
MLGGTLNAVAGGGSFFSFPALLFVGVPPISANATSAAALWPGSVASTIAYRRELARQDRSQLLLLSAISLAGGLIGALLLLRTEDITFARLIPYLLLVATLIFASSNTIVRRLRAHEATHPTPAGLRRLLVPLGQFFIAIYGGFFGGGIGILMLAALAVAGMEDIHEMNAVKTLLATIINGISVLTFILAGVVRWPEALVMVAGAIVGGYGAAAIARKIPPPLVRRFVILVGIVLTLYFFLK